MKQILAALIFFTRLPFWRLGDVPAEMYRNVVRYWPFVGWLTGGIMAGVFYLASFVLPVSCAAVLALVARLLVTGALHEDGLADFFDGFGGGTDRQRILAIMKDSHIGTYGVLALVVYYILLVCVISSLSVGVVCCAMVACDSWSKFAASNIVNFLPYARTEQEAKNHTVYNKVSPGGVIAGCIGGALPLLLLPWGYQTAAIAPVVVAPLLFAYMKRKIRGYTGDCCGATFLICELSMWLAIAVTFTLIL